MPKKKKVAAVGPKIQLRNAKRAQAVEAVRRGEPVSVVAHILRVPLRTVFHWVAVYRQKGAHGLLEKHRTGRPRKVTAEIMEWIYDAITLGDPRQYQLPFRLWTLNLVRKVLKEQFGIELSKSGVSRLLGHLGLTPQRPIYKSFKQDTLEIRKYLDVTFPGLRDEAKKLGANIYFVDESAVRSDSHRGTTWGKSGQTPVVEDSGDRFGLNLISAVSPRGDMRFACFEGKMNAERFIEFIGKLLEDAGVPIIVIADNASYHRAAPIKEYVAKSDGKIRIAHLPRYSPELNPDEQVWNYAKAKLAKLYIATKTEFKTAILSIMFSIQRSAALVRSFFQLKDTKYAANI